MAIEIKIGDRTAHVQLIRQNGNLLEVEVDGKLYRVDLLHTPDGTFSIIENGKSYNIELVPESQPKKYTAYTRYQSYPVELIDAESRYLSSRGKNGTSDHGTTIISPMPGKVVRVLKAEGDTISKGETAIVVSAMKMESEYKSPADGIVKKIYVHEGDTIEGEQILIEIS